jgi:hypothetical protein
LGVLGILEWVAIMVILIGLDWRWWIEELRFENGQSIHQVQSFNIYLDSGTLTH